MFAPPTIDLSNSGLKEFQQPEFEGYGFKANTSVCEKSLNEFKKTTDAPIIEDWVSDCDEDESEVMALKSDNVQHKPEQANQPKKVTVLTKSGIVPISTARQSSSRAVAPVSAARPINNVAPKPFVNVAKTRPNAFQKSHSLSRRPFHQQTALKNRNLNNKVNTAKVNRVTSAVGKQGINVGKSSACWVWRPKIKVPDHVSKNSGSYSCLELKGYLINDGYVDLVKLLYG
ncbi:hypothetical protein Tco_1450912 [Tanacetum coccineum]